MLTCFIKQITQPKEAFIQKKHNVIFSKMCKFRDNIVDLCR